MDNLLTNTDVVAITDEQYEAITASLTDIQSQIHTLNASANDIAGILGALFAVLLVFAVWRVWWDIINNLTQYF